MCGRAKLPDDVSEIKLDLKIDFDETGDYRPRWNAAPTSKLPVVVSHHGQRTLTLMRWGLIPSWAKDHQDRPFDLQCPCRRCGQPPRLPLRLAGRPPLPGHCRRLLRVARCRQTTFCCNAWQSRADDLRRPMGPMARPGRHDHQILHHHHHPSQRTSSAITCTYAGSAGAGPLAGMAWRNHGRRCRTQGHAAALSRRRHDVLAGRPPRRQCTQRQSRFIRAHRPDGLTLAA